MPTLADGWTWNTPDDPESRLYGAYTVVELPVTGITQDPLLDPRGGLDPARVRRRVEQRRTGAVFPPIRVVLLDDETLLLADGWARLGAEVAITADTIRAQHTQSDAPPPDDETILQSARETTTIVARVVRGTRDDAMLLGVYKNEENGDVLTPSARRRMAEQLWQNPSLRRLSVLELARRTGMERHVLQDAKRLVVPDTETILVSRNGVEYEMTPPRRRPPIAPPDRPAWDPGTEDDALLASASAPGEPASTGSALTRGGDRARADGESRFGQAGRPAERPTRAAPRSAQFAITAYRDGESASYALQDLPLSLRLELQAQLESIESLEAYSRD